MVEGGQAIRETQLVVGGVTLKNPKQAAPSLKCTRLGLAWQQVFGIFSPEGIIVSGLRENEATASPIRTDPHQGTRNFLGCCGQSRAFERCREGISREGTKESPNPNRDGDLWRVCGLPGSASCSQTPQKFWGLATPAVQLSSRTPPPPPGAAGPAARATAAAEHPRHWAAAGRGKGHFGAEWEPRERKVAAPLRLAATLPPHPWHNPRLPFAWHPPASTCTLLQHIEGIPHSARTAPPSPALPPDSPSKPSAPRRETLGDSGVWGRRPQSPTAPAGAWAPSGRKWAEQTPTDGETGKGTPPSPCSSSPTRVCQPESRGGGEKRAPGKFIGEKPGT